MLTEEISLKHKFSNHKSFFLKIMILTIFTNQIYSQMNNVYIPSLLRGRVDENSQCRNLEGLGHPVKIIKTYFQQLFTNFYINSDMTDIQLVFYKEFRENVSRHKFIFRLKNVFSQQYEYIGILTVVPPPEMKTKNYHHVIIRYINTKDFESVKLLLGDHGIKEQEEIPCEGLKENFVSSIIEKPFTPYTCRYYETAQTVNSSNISTMLRYNINAVQRVLRLFGFNVSIDDLVRNREIVDQIWEAYQDFNFLRNDILIMRSKINSFNEIPLDRLIRTSYVGQEERCKNPLDIEEECAMRSSDSKCLDISDAVTLLNFVTMFYMMNKKVVIHGSDINGIVNVLLLINQ